MGPLAMPDCTVATTSSISLRTILWTGLTGLGAVVEALVEPHERLVLQVVEIEKVGRRGRVVSLAHKIGLRVFESAGNFHLIPDPQEQGARVVGKAADQMRPERRQVALMPGGERRHARAGGGAGSGR